MKRTSCFSAILAAFTLLSPAVLGSVAQASAPQIKTQGPGFYRTMVGDIEVTTLFDGFFMLKPKELMKKAPPAKIDQLVAASRQAETIPTSVNAFLVNTGSKLILVDSGCGAFMGNDYGKIAGNLKASGYSPEQVDEVVITHMHTDHLGGVAAAGKAAFPHAALRIDQKDVDFWLNPEHAKGLPEMVGAMITHAIAAVAPYKALGQFKPFQGKTEIAPGVTALPAYGHTPGHTVYAIESQGKKLLLVGDLLHVEAVQFPEPGIGPIFDSDGKEATQRRQAIFKEAATQGYLLGAAHLPFPGIGHVIAAKPGYRYLPAPYSPL